MAHKYIVILKLFHFSNAWDQHEFTNTVSRNTIRFIRYPSAYFLWYQRHFW